MERFSRIEESVGKRIQETLLCDTPHVKSIQDADSLASLPAQNATIMQENLNFDTVNVHNDSQIVCRSKMYVLAKYQTCTVTYKIQ